jgi:hypothetical protein
MTEKKSRSGQKGEWTTYNLEGSELSRKVGPAPGVRTPRKRNLDRWRYPMDLTPELAARLLSGLAENHRNRLELLVRKGGRASIKDLLAVTGDHDLRVISYFQGALSRKIRRIAGDQDKRLHLIGWDYTTTKWNADHTMIIDGDCYITHATLVALRDAFGSAPRRRRPRKT